MDWTQSFECRCRKYALGLGKKLEREIQEENLRIRVFRQFFTIDLWMEEKPGKFVILMRCFVLIVVISISWGSLMIP